MNTIDGYWCLNVMDYEAQERADVFLGYQDELDEEEIQLLNISVLQGHVLLIPTIRNVECSSVDLNIA